MSDVQSTPTDLLASLDVEPWAVYADQLDRILASGIGNDVQRTALRMIAESCRTAARLLAPSPVTFGTLSREKNGTPYRGETT